MKGQSTLMLGMIGEFLKLRGQATIAQAEFNPIWYQQKYPDARVAAEAADAEGADEAVLQFYLIAGQQLGFANTRESQPLKSRNPYLQPQPFDRHPPPL